MRLANAEPNNSLSNVVRLSGFGPRTEDPTTPYTYNRSDSLHYRQCGNPLKIRHCVDTVIKVIQRLFTFEVFDPKSRSVQ